MTFSGRKCFFHVDLDAFFASVEQLVHPEWRGKPVIVGGLPGDRRSVVSTASYEARKFGVHSAMPLSRAVELCPNGIYTRGNYKLYQEYSQKIMSIFSDFSPDVRPISIDEAFLDMTGTERLFGDPVDCAKKLKRDVFEKTGLTVSVGVATTNYIAKISSGLKKPDGLYVVAPGEEENFMLSLPLEKVWGVGGKTLERLRGAGFNSTKDIRSHSKELLSSVFGEAQAGFLYNIVRGLEPEGFLSEAKSHSAGIETTYDYDLLEWNAIEGALLSLSEQLMFRLLKENITGKTVSVKIRYDDFTTVSAQSSSLQNVTSVDDLFSRATKIFRSKYQAGRGIRLLGITVLNTSAADSEKQNELFDFGETKRKQIEKAILKIEQKNPEVKIHKARLLNSSSKKQKAVALFLAAALSILCANKAAADDTKTIEASGSGPMVVGKDLPPEKEPEGAKLFERNINDNQVEFIAQGYWDAKLKQTLNATFGFGKPFTFSSGAPVLVQQVDLTLSFFLNKHWYLQAAFADEFNKNTYAVGYTNGQGYLKEFRVSNRKIVFPSSYSVDDVNRGIGGGENQAPGVSTSFSDVDGKWTLDAALRYDMLTSRDKTYYGRNSVNDSSKSKSSFLTGRMYVVPSFDTAAAIKDVFVESYNGPFLDGAGRKYKKLSSSDFLVVPSRKMIVLSASAGASRKNGVLPAVAVSFSTSAAVAKCFSELGNFGQNTLAQEGSGFLGDTQKAFGYRDDDDNDYKDLAPNVASFSYCGKAGEIPIPDPSGAAPASVDSCGFFGKIDGGQVLFIQHPAGFSPFTVCFRYDLGINTADEVMVVHSQSGKRVDGYSALAVDDDLAITEENYFSEKRYYADVYNTRVNSNDYANAAVRYPFCGTSPGSYLGYSNTDDVVIRSRNYTPVKRFDIGTDAISGTVIVYKNGVIDSGAKYNPETGEVVLSSSVGNSDKIYIVWYEDSKSFDSGSIAGAAGFKYNFTDKLSGDVSLAGRWTLPLEKKYAEASKSYFGYGTLATKVNYAGEIFSAGNTISGTVENKNTSGYYKALSFDDSGTVTSYNPQNAAKKLPANFAPRLNQRPSEPQSFAIDLESAFNCSQPIQNGSTDIGISGYKIPIQWNWTGNAFEWAANTIAISGGGLSNASTFSVALKVPATFSGDVYLQLGVNADENFQSETKGSIPTWKISDSFAPDVLQALGTGKSGWQTVKVMLRDSDRAQCVQYKNARIIVVNSNSEKGAGTIYFGPYEVSSQGIFTLAGQDIAIASGQTRAINPRAARFNTATNFAQEVSWLSQADQTPDDSKITMYKYFTEADQSDYNEINLYFRLKYEGSHTIGALDTDPGLVFLLDTDSPSVTGIGKTAAYAAISKRALANFCDNNWRLLTIDKSENSVKIDGYPIAVSDRILVINNSVVPTRLKIQLNTSGENFWNERGTIALDEFYYSNTTARFVAQDKNFVECKKAGVLLETQNGTPVFSDFKARLSSDESVTIYSQQNRNAKGDISANASLSFTAAQIAVDLAAARIAGSDNALSTASHSISTASPLFKTIDFAERYNYDGDGKSAAKENSLKLNFKNAGVPLILSGNTQVDSSEWASNSKASESAELKFGGESGGYLLRLSSSRGQKNQKSNGADTIQTGNYFYTWLEATKNEFTSGDSMASKRNVGVKIENTVFLPWASLSPKINFSSEENYAAAKNYYYTDKSVFELAVPFKVGSNFLEFSWKKTNGAVESTSRGGDYAEDYEELFRSYGNRKYYFAAAPIYDLISWNLSDCVFSKTKNLTAADSSESEYFNAEYSLTYKRNLFADKRDFFIPANVTFAFSRDIRAAKTLSDTYQSKLKLTWTAFNIFGKNGSMPIASWFEQDEYLTSFIATLKFPRGNPSDISQVYTTYFQANFYITKSNILKNGVEFEIQDQNNFRAKGTISWKRPGKASVITALSRLFFKKLRGKEIPITRSDSVNCSWKQSSGSNSSAVQKTQTYEFSHGADFQFAKYFTMTTQIDLGLNVAINEICSATASFSLGGKLNF